MTFFLSDNRGTLEEREEHAEEQEEEEEEREKKDDARERERSSRCCCCYRGCGEFKKARTDDPRDVGRDRCCLARGYFFIYTSARILCIFSSSLEHRSGKRILLSL